MLSRILLRVVLVAALALGAACAKKALLDREVHAENSESLAAFRTDLGNAFSPQELQPFDTAIQELKLQAMNSGVAGVAAREEKMRSAVNGKSVRDVLILGWQARRARTQAELADMSARLEHDRQLRNKPGSDVSTTYIANLIKNEEDIVAQLKRQIADTDEKLALWGAKPDAESKATP